MRKTELVSWCMGEDLCLAAFNAWPPGAGRWRESTAKGMSRRSRLLQSVMSCLSAGCCGLPAAAVQGQHCSPQQHPGWIYTSDFCAPMRAANPIVCVQRLIDQRTYNTKYSKRSTGRKQRCNVVTELRRARSVVCHTYT